MALQIQRVPGGVNVTRKNPTDGLYIKGDEFTDGSVREILGADNITVVERRDNGVWNAADLRLSEQTLHLGHDLDVSAIADTLLIHSNEDDRRFLVPETPFTDTGTEPVRWTNAGPRLNRLVFLPDLSTDNVSNVHSISLNLPGVQAFSYVVYVQIGAIAPISPVKMVIETGLVINAGTVFLERNFAANVFPANTEISLEQGAGIGVRPGDSFTISFTSDDPFSILGSASGTPWMAVDFQNFMYEELVSLHTGTDKFVVDDNTGGVMVDASGNIMSFEFGD